MINILTKSDNTTLGCRTYKLGLLAQPRLNIKFQLERLSYILRVYLAL
jgi:hypothetical protein